MRYFLAFQVAILVFSQSLFGGSVRLFNDSTYKLRAVIRGADGSYLGEMIVMPQNNTNWNDSYQNFGAYTPQNPYKLPSRSQTPYTVIWYCMDGNNFSVCTQVSTGGTVTASTCEGTKICKPPPKKQLAPTQPEAEELYERNYLEQQLEKQLKQQMEQEMKQQMQQEQQQGQSGQ